ncbi:DUF5959 family protein [Streptomyces sp. NPDC058464]|uniref:DUF5959 family protein n=1 Tax=Streptomyces sp. NPDC058464 TaxID=3346511 RepID=UPI00365474AB
MGDIIPREIISPADDEGNSVTVNVLGRNPRWAAGLDAEIVVGTTFVSGRCHLPLSDSKMGRGRPSPSGSLASVAVRRWL